MKNIETKARALILDFMQPVDELHKYPMCFDTAKQCSLISINENIKLIKNILNQSTQIHQSLSTPKKLCIDVLNPILKKLEEVKKEIEKI